MLIEESGTQLAEDLVAFLNIMLKFKFKKFFSYSTVNYRSDTVSPIEKLEKGYINLFLRKVGLWDLNESLTVELNPSRQYLVETGRIMELDKANLIESS